MYHPQQIAQQQLAQQQSDQQLHPPPNMAMMAAPGGGPAVHDYSFPCVKLRGLPYDAVESDVPVFLGMVTVDVLFVKQYERFTGEAFVVLQSPAQMELALAKNKSYLGRRYVEVFRASKLDYYKAVAYEMHGGFPMQHPYAPHGIAARPRRQLTAPGYAPDGEATNVVKLRGLPWTVRTDQLIHWFADLPIQPPPAENVHIVSEGGRPTGIAYMEFASPHDAAQALAKDKQMMGHRYVEVFPSNKEELMRYVQGAGV